MPSLKEAAVAVTGVLMDIEALVDYDTKKSDGSLKVVVSTGDGFAAVKIVPEDARALGALNHFDRVSWMVRYGAWARNENAQTTCRFVREITEDDLDKLVSGRAAVAAASSK